MSEQKLMWSITHQRLEPVDDAVIERLLCAQDQIDWYERRDDGRLLHLTALQVRKVVKP